MTKCCPSIVTGVSRESLIGGAPFTNERISQYPSGAGQIAIDPIFISWDDRCIIGGYG